MSHLTQEPIDPGPLLAEVRRDGDGGIALFVGVVRDENDGHAVEFVDYEAYAPMAERELAAIAEELGRRFPGAAVRIRHRIGNLRVGEVSVVVAVSAPHRDEAFAACREGIEAVKARVPVWKREHGPTGESWVDPTVAGPLHESR